MQRATIFSLVLLFIMISSASAEQTIRLRVSATIPPRACEFPDPCDPLPAQLKNVVTSVTVSADSIRYVGSPPEVTKKDDLMTVKF